MMSWHTPDQASRENDRTSASSMFRAEKDDIGRAGPRYISETYYTF